MLTERNFKRGFQAWLERLEWCITAQETALREKAKKSDIVFVPYRHSLKTFDCKCKNWSRGFYLMMIKWECAIAWIDGRILLFLN